MALLPGPHSEVGVNLYVLHLNQPRLVVLLLAGIVKFLCSSLYGAVLDLC